MSGPTSDLRQYVQAIKARWWVVVITTIVAIGAVYFRLHNTPATYNASATLMVTAPMLNPPSVAEGPEAGVFRPSQATVTNDVVQLINSRPIATRVARRLGLPSPGEVQRAVNAGALRGTSLVRVSATARRADRAADLANVTAEEFVLYFRDTNRASMTESRRFVEDQLAQARTRLEASERGLQAFKESRGMPSVPAASAQAMADAAAGQSAYETATMAFREAEARLVATRARLTNEPAVVVASQATTDNPVWRQIQTRIVDLEIQRTTLGQIYTPQHPRMEQFAREIAEVRGRLTNEARTFMREEVTANNPIHVRLQGDIVGLEVERAALAARVEALRLTQRRRQAAVMSIPSAEAQFNRLLRDQRVHEANYTTLSSRYQDMLLRENQAGFFPASLQVIEAAIPPARPLPLSLPRTAAAAGFAGVVMGIVVALLLESLDDRIRSAQDAEHVLGVPVLAQIPSQGHVRAAPATAIFAIGIALAATAATAAVARGYVAMPEAATGGIRTVATTVSSTVSSWIASASR